MAINDITLSGGMRANLANLQLVSMLQNRTSERLATGLRVNKATDDPTAYFAAQNHRSRASDLAARKDTMGEAIQTVNSADEGIKAITTLIEQAKGLTSSARSAGATERAALATQFGALMTQIDDLAGDAGYKGTNFLSSGVLTVDFNEDSSSSLTITGFDGTSTGLGVAAAANAWVADTDIDAAVADLDAALVTLRSEAKSLASNVAVVTARQSFTSGMINTLSVGADNLTAADSNEEAQQGILRLFYPRGSRDGGGDPAVHPRRRAAPERIPMALRIRLKPRERILVGGAVLTNGPHAAEFMVDNEVPVLRGRDVLAPRDAGTPCRRIVLALQLVYVDPDEAGRHAGTYRQLADEALAAAPSLGPTIRAIDRALTEGRIYDALKQARRLVEREQELMNHVR
jgi:flagellin